ncbi:MAG: cbb3-type cytochrome c oxidase N-terminal domain-containing protein [Ferruginibacter sp.]
MNCSKIKTTFKNAALLTALTAGLPLLSMAQNAAAPASSGADGYMVMRWVLLAIAAVLLFAVAVLANAVTTTGKLYMDKQKEKTGITKQVLSSLALLLFSSLAFAQGDAAPPIVQEASMPWDIYLFISAIVIECLAIFFLIKALFTFLDIKSQKEEALARTGKPRVTFFQKINQTVAMEEEDKLDMKHDYDGISELDNKVPGWWSLAFYGTILFAAVYLYRFFIADTFPRQLDELAMANEKAIAAKTQYLKLSASNVDENTVTMGDAAAISAGAELFKKNCVACHADKGQGNQTGPNLTDDYWLHKGGLKDVFYTIKYGWPEKGMRSWKDDFSPAQIAQLSSFVKSLKGSNPPGAKEPQGEKWTEEAAAPAITDSVAKAAPVAADSTAAKK